ncbi:MAG: SapC family protein [Gammaproteobacteria bacterium]|nr:SapC family protein [Gammaproteobacteria bacterium]
MPTAPVNEKNGINPGSIVPFESGRHAGLGLKRTRLRHFAASRHAFAISLPEFFYAARHYPVVFVKSEDNEMRASVITGLRHDENLFVDAQGEWREQAYVPAYVRRFPFYIADAADGSAGKKMIMVDESGLEESDDPFFDAAGEATDKWRAQETLIADFIAAESRTVEFSARMAELDLLEAFDARVNPESQNSMHVTGMYRVNEDRLNRLPAKTIKAMMSRGELSRVYAHLISLENFAKLLDLSAVDD